MTRCTHEQLTIACGCYIDTEEDVLEDEQLLIAELMDERGMSCPDADYHGWWGCTTCGLRPSS